MAPTAFDSNCNLFAIIILVILLFDLSQSDNNQELHKHQDRKQLKVSHHSIKKRDVLTSSLNKLSDGVRWKNPCKSDNEEELIMVLKEGYNVKKNDTDTNYSILGKFISVTRGLPQRALSNKLQGKSISKKKPLTAVGRTKRSLSFDKSSSITTTKQDCCDSYDNEQKNDKSQFIVKSDEKRFGFLQKELNKIEESEYYSGKKSAILFKRPKDKNYGIKKTSFSILKNTNSPSYLNKINGRSNNRYFYSMQPTSVPQMGTTTILLDNNKQALDSSKIVNKTSQTNSTNKYEIRDLFSSFLLNKFKIVLNSNYALKHILTSQNLYFEIIGRLSLKINNVTNDSTRKGNNTYGSWLPDLNNLTNVQNEPDRAIELLYKMDKYFQYYAVAIEQFKSDQSKFLHGIDYGVLEESNLKILCQIKKIINIIREMVEIQRVLHEDFVNSKKEEPPNFDRYIQFILSQISSSDFDDFEKVYYPRDIILSTFKWIYRQNEKFKIPEENKREIVERSVMPQDERRLEIEEVYHRDFNIMNSLKILGDMYKSVLSQLQNEHMTSTSM